MSEPFHSFPVSYGFPQTLGRTLLHSFGHQQKSLQVSASFLQVLSASSIASERRASGPFSAIHATFPFRLAISNLLGTCTCALQPALAITCISLLCFARLFCPLHASYPKLYALRPVVTTIPDTLQWCQIPPKPLNNFALYISPQALDTFSSLLDYTYTFVSLC